MTELKPPRYTGSLVKNAYWAFSSRSILFVARFLSGFERFYYYWFRVI